MKHGLSLCQALGSGTPGAGLCVASRSLAHTCQIKGVTRDETKVKALKAVGQFLIFNKVTGPKISAHT